MLLYLKTILFGIVEGITEWLPISSTGHMILLNEFVKLDVSKDFYSMFQVVIQLGAILAVVVIYWNQIWPFKKNTNPMVKGFFKYVDRDIFDLWLKIIFACIPAAVVGLLFDDVFEALFYNPPCVALALIVFGIGFIVIENRNASLRPKINSLKAINGKTAFLIGMFQLIAAIFPGTSRSGATILGGLMLGVSRTVAAEFTFFLAIPVMFGLAFTVSQLAVLGLGMLVAFVSSILIIKFLMSYIKKHDFKVFGWYRIVLGLLVLAYFFIIK